MAKVIVEPVATDGVEVPFSWWKVVLAGLVMGALFWGVALLLERYVVDLILCRSNAEACSRSFSIAGNISTVIVAIIGTVALIQLRVYRPLLVTGASLASLWGLTTLLGAVSAAELLVWAMLLYSAAYAVYSAIMRLSSTFAAVGLSLIVIVLARLIIQL